MVLKLMIVIGSVANTVFGSLLNLHDPLKIIFFFQSSSTFFVFLILNIFTLQFQSDDNPQFLRCEFSNLLYQLILHHGFYYYYFLLLFSCENHLFKKIIRLIIGVGVRQGGNISASPSCPGLQKHHHREVTHGISYTYFQVYF